MTIQPDMNAVDPAWPVYEIMVSFVDGGRSIQRVPSSAETPGPVLTEAVGAMAQALFDADWPGQSVLRVSVTEVSLMSRLVLELTPDSEMAVTGITPDSGPTGGGTPVTISGRNFGTNPAVGFRSEDGYWEYGRESRVVNPETITCITPPSASWPPGKPGPHDVEVVTWADGTPSRSLLPYGFTFTPDPVGSVRPRPEHGRKS